MADMEQLLQVFYPHDIPGVTKTRIGPNCDGGYIIPLELTKKCKSFFSFGIGHNYTTEWDLANLVKKTVYLYDHTIPLIPDNAENRDGACLIHAQKGLSAVTYDKNIVNICSFYSEVSTSPADNLISLAEAIKNKESPIFLKMDVDGAEWETLKDIPTLNKIDIFVLELHGLINIPNYPVFYEAVYDTLTNLRKKFVTFHVHGNNFGPPMVYGAVHLSHCIEITLVNIAWLQELGFTYAKSTAKYPIPGLDFPCCHWVPEHPVCFE